MVTIPALVLLTASVAVSQPAVPEPSCDAQVAAQYLQLVAEQLLPALPPAQSATCSQQVLAMATQLRLQKTEYDIRKNQEELAVRNVAQLLEQIRQLRQVLSAREAEIDSLKKPQ